MDRRVGGEGGRLLGRWRKSPLKERGEISVHGETRPLTREDETRNDKRKVVHVQTGQELPETIGQTGGKTSRTQRGSDRRSRSSDVSVAVKKE